MGSSLSQKYELDLALQTFSEVPLKYTNYFWNNISLFKMA
jgi:hypothetical protein